MLRLFNNGDIDIIREIEPSFDYEIVYHKTFNPSENLKDNLDNAFKEWEKLFYKEVEE